MKKLCPVIEEKKNETTPNVKLYKDLEVDTLARTIWGEARGEGSAGMQAVACVILNRLHISQERNGFWWGNNLIEICQKPYQFSCWNKDDPNRKKMMQVTSQEDLHFASAVRIARRGIYASLQDLTGGSDHYHAVSVMPYWAKYEKPICVIGNHIFYRLS
jgi:N-acetylmuramoyl-L-alanine amidase